MENLEPNVKKLKILYIKVSFPVLLHVINLIEQTMPKAQERNQLVGPKGINLSRLAKMFFISLLVQMAKIKEPDVMTTS